ncbi:MULTISPECIES: DMT family transporter [Thalassobaculum]|uniref:Permease of the drug/metabolite transporter (DMT) superfamily n=1 Tax=Thalassobaculum litoreum DSM 18839 TaxID=1123362 RepID=A0A8G2BNB9_9PROT|nr:MULTISPECIES: DMT family transporter [Thalassobaculum]SDG28794.1 Permease of the drug/metabolite transporter (DMT) superfamily [Thalassobaculum litoreum DSM 18839]
MSTAARGILLILLANFGFAGMDAVSKTLTMEYSVAQILWVRFAFFAAFATVLAWRRGGGILPQFRTTRPVFQTARALLLVAEIGCFILGFRYLQLAESHSIGAVFPLVITALSALWLGEQVGVRRWTAVGIGFIGMLVILRPGLAVFEVAALLPLAGAIMFAVYQVMTKLLSRTDGMVTILLYTGWVGFLAMSLFGPFDWTWPDAKGWALLVLAGLLGSIGHATVIKALEIAPASVLQPFNYTLLVWATGIGFVVFGDLPDLWTVVGATVIVASGLYVWWRERVRAARADA